METEKSEKKQKLTEKSINDMLSFSKHLAECLAILTISCIVVYFSRNQTMMGINYVLLIVAIYAFFRMRKKVPNSGGEVTEEYLLQVDKIHAVNRFAGHVFMFMLACPSIIIGIVVPNGIMFYIFALLTFLLVVVYVVLFTYPKQERKNGFKNSSFAVISTIVVGVIVGSVLKFIINLIF